ncbi:hypothetical protein FB567DRAFT_589166 [Paraphoma chrysanthemicola]|uniref:Uncharacterized protein n=1 Tax=Paraphoma chrysanthemicola TaxID=798071 RepID=A0A8K0RA73_9PLEO|nr:hypothetical protein FB567DRAFT_589166 [Paraphoma chrysanthemicola]
MTKLPSLAPDINSNSTPSSTLLANLDDQIRRLDLKITYLTNNKCILEQARAFISFHTANNPTDPQSPSNDTYTRPYTPTRRPPSNLRREAIVRNALERDRAVSPQRTAGLLASEDFEAAFESNAPGSRDAGEVREARMFVENNGSLSLPDGEGASGSSASVPPLLRSDAVGTVGARGKRATKRKFQEHAGKTREAKRRKSNPYDL